MQVERQTIQATASNNKSGIKVEVITPFAIYPTVLPTTIKATPAHDKRADRLGNRIIVRVIDECYYPTERKVGLRINPLFWLNILAGGIGFSVDFITGIMWRYDSDLTVYVSPINNGECEDKS